MKTLAATLLISAFAVAPAMASCFDKTAKTKTPEVTASAAPQVEEQAMSTFDPAQKPAFDTTRKIEETVASEDKAAD